MQRREQEQPRLPHLPEGPLVEILARVPYKSLCRFKCVSKPWFALCSSQDILKRSPQTLSGFFYHDGTPNKFRNLSGRGPPLVDPSLRFLCEIYAHISIDHVCGGLLLCSGRKSCDMEDQPDYVVCNPLTEEWTVLPPIVYPNEQFDGEFDRDLEPLLCFDAAVPCFLVFVSLTIQRLDYGDLAIYSSETRQWSYILLSPVKDLDYDPRKERRVFLDGTMHWLSQQEELLTFDSEGKLGREIEVPRRPPKSFERISIGKSQGRLYAWKRADFLDPKLYIWVFEDYGTGKWTLKHTIKVLELFGRHCRDDNKYDAYPMFALHPDCNVIFLTDGKKTAVSYDFDSHKVDIIFPESVYGLPYIPCFAELPSAGH